MNLTKLFEMQRQLDEHIEQEHPRQEGEERLSKKILALQVELGELANEVPEVFKFWKFNHQSRTKVFDFDTWKKNGCKTDGNGRPIECYKNRVLEEYVDCLHFILSIGLELKYTNPSIIAWKSNAITKRFNNLFHAIATLEDSISCDWNEDEIQENFDYLLSLFVGLGEMLGFTWEQIEQAYFEKNKINHERQEHGY